MRRQLKDFVVTRRDPDTLTRRRRELLGAEQPSGDLLLGDLLGGRAERFVCDTPVHAKIYEREVTRALRSLKIFLAGNARTGRARSFDL